VLNGNADVANGLFLILKIWRGMPTQILIKKLPTLFKKNIL
jgi:hypothetical protein